MEACRLLSLWDMYKFRAQDFVLLSRQLGIIEGIIKLGLANDLKLSTELTPLVKKLRSILTSIGLNVSLGFVDKIEYSITKKEPVVDTMRIFQNLNDTIEIELSREYFLGLTSTEVTYIEPKKFLLGNTVELKLPEIIEDVAEASKCFGFGRYTASVFHLMRVMETSVQKFGDKLGVSLIHASGREKNWQPLLDEANKAIKALNQNEPVTKKYSAIASNLYNVKLAWRNEVMHPKETYTEEEALNLISAVKAFTNELASVL